jgi:hypothetical protein
LTTFASSRGGVVFTDEHHAGPSRAVCCLTFKSREGGEGEDGGLDARDDDDDDDDDGGVFVAFGIGILFREGTGWDDPPRRRARAVDPQASNAIDGMEGEASMRRPRADAV